MKAHAQMTWAEREYARTRLAQLDRDDATYAIALARLILADLPAEPPLECARRRRVLDDAAAGYTVGRPLRRTNKAKSTIGDAA